MDRDMTVKKVQNNGENYSTAPQFTSQEDAEKLHKQRLSNNLQVALCTGNTKGPEHTPVAAGFIASDNSINTLA